MSKASRILELAMHAAGGRRMAGSMFAWLNIIVKWAEVTRGGDQTQGNTKMCLDN